MKSIQGHARYEMLLNATTVEKAKEVFIGVQPSDWVSAHIDHSNNVIEELSQLLNDLAVRYVQNLQYVKRNKKKGTYYQTGINELLQKLDTYNLLTYPSTLNGKLPRIKHGDGSACLYLSEVTDEQEAYYNFTVAINATLANYQQALNDTTMRLKRAILTDH